MEANPAYGISLGDNETDGYYEVDYLTKVTKESVELYSEKMSRQEDMKSKSRCKRTTAICAGLTIAALLLLLPLAAIAISTTLYKTVQFMKLEMERLGELNQDVLDTIIQNEQQLQQLRLKGTIQNPASSCADVLENSLSGQYWIQNNNTLVQVYCDMTRTCCSTTGGWTRVADLDMTDESQQCPDRFRLVNRTTAPLRTCGRPGPAGCTSAIFPVHGIEYSQVCGRVVSYHYGSPTAFALTNIDEAYVDGVSLTYGSSPRQHIWTFAAALSEGTHYNPQVCPCTQGLSSSLFDIPSFIGDDYFCDTGNSGIHTTNEFFAGNPLWDGQGCGGTSTCCSFNNPPWFCKQLPQPTTDDIELRLCANEDTDNEDTPIEIAEIYIH